MGAVEVPHAPRGWDVEMGYPIPTGGRVRQGAAAPPRKFIVFIVENTTF